MISSPVLKWGVAETMGPRETMEDAWFVKENLKAGILYASIFDGHGGSSSALFLKRKLFDMLKIKMKRQHLFIEEQLAKKSIEKYNNQHNQ